jgi:hypothetical protein
MRQIFVVVATIAIGFFFAPVATADFLVGDVFFPERVRNDGSFVRGYGVGVPIPHESYDTFALSANGRQVYIFANDLGSITAEPWDVDTGAYLGDPFFGGLFPRNPFPGQPWPNFFQPNYAIGGVQTRTSFPAFGGDLLYVAPIRFNSGFGFTIQPVIHVVNTSTYQTVEQIVPPSSVTAIYDFALGPGLLGVKSRAYLSTNIGLLVFEEKAETSLFPVPDFSHFQLVSTTPLLTGLSSSAEIDVGPSDGYLYVLDGAGTESRVQRYNTTTGALIDTFLTYELYNSGGFPGQLMKFGPDGDLYISANEFRIRPTDLSRLLISRFQVSTGQKTAVFDLGDREITDFFVLQVPELSSLVLATLGLAILACRKRSC